jgi:hypothetical protein
MQTAGGLLCRSGAPASRVSATAHQGPDLVASGMLPARRDDHGPFAWQRIRPLDREFRRAVLAGLASVPRMPGPKNSTKQRPGRELLEFCRDRRDEVLRFTTDMGIWPTNNISERGVRPLKTQQEISGRLASNDITQDRLDIRSYIDTTRKHGMNAMDVLHELMLGRPWRPPGAAISP